MLSARMYLHTNKMYLHTKDEVGHIVLGLLALLLEHARPICKDQTPTGSLCEPTVGNNPDETPIFREGFENLMEETMTRARRASTGRGARRASTGRGAQNGTKSKGVSTQYCSCGIPVTSRISQLQAP